MTIFGKIKNWNEPRGFGFVRRDDGQPDVFLHVSEVKAAHIQGIGPGYRIAFDLKPGIAGKAPAACKVWLEAKPGSGDDAALMAQVFMR